MLKKIYNSYIDFITVYFYPILFGLGFLVSLSYTFTAIDAYHFGGIIYRVILSIFLLGLSTPLIVRYRKGINRKIFLLSFAFLLCNLLATCVAPFISKTNIDCLNSFLGIGSSVFIAISILLYQSLDETEINEKVFKITTLSFVGLVSLLCIYTYIFEYKDIYNSIFNEHGWNYDVTSIFKIKTEYGNYLLVGIFLSLVYFLKYKNKLIVIPLVFFFINMFLSRSKTSLVISIPLLFVFFVLLIKDGLNNHKKATFIACSVSFCILLAFVFLCAFNVGIFGPIDYFIKQTIFNDGIVVIKDRLSNWSQSFLQLNNFFVIVFGYGERIGAKLINGSGDNYYIYSLVSGGIMRLFLYLFLVVYCIVSLSREKELTKSIKAILILLQVLILLIGLTDTVGVVGFTYSAIFYGFIFFGVKKVFKTKNSRVE